MHHFFSFAFAGVILAAGQLQVSADSKKLIPDEPACTGYNTAVKFYDSPTVAAKQAFKEEKLVMVLHVSGNFEDPKFT